MKLKPKREKWRDPDVVKTGSLYIAWITGTKLPHFRLLAKDEVYTDDGVKTGKIIWTDEHADKKIPRKWIKAVHKLPSPKKIGPDWMGANE